MCAEQLHTTGPETLGGAFPLALFFAFARRRLIRDCLRTRHVIGFTGRDLALAGMGVRGLHLIIVASIVTFSLTLSISFTNSTRRGPVITSPPPSPARPYFPVWVYTHKLESYFNLSTVNNWRQPPSNPTHNSSSLFFDPTILPSLYSVAGSLPNSISIVEWKRISPSPRFQPQIDPRTCDDPYDWRKILTPFPNDTAYPPGATHKEWDSICRPDQYQPPDQSTPVLRIQQAYVEGGPGYKPRHQRVYALVFNHEVALQLERWVMDPDLWFRPPSVPQRVEGRRIESHACLASVTGTAYPFAFGHFPLQVFPRIVRLLALTPATCPLLISNTDYSAVKKALALLREIGLLDDSRRIITQNTSVLYYADLLYFSDGPPVSPPNALLLNRMITAGLGGPWLPSTVVYLKRSPGRRALETKNEEAMLRIMQEEFSQTLVVFKSSANLTEDALLFGKAGLVVGPHGAGFTNIQFCPQSAVVLEIGYDGFFPDYYMRLASALGLGYHNIIGDGNYSSTLTVNLDKFRTVFAAALDNSVLPHPRPK